MVAIATTAAGLAAVGVFQGLPYLKLVQDPKVDALIKALVGLGIVVLAGKFTDGAVRIVLIGAGAGAIAYGGLSAYRGR
jgi:hypothetical protein